MTGAVLSGLMAGGGFGTDGTAFEAEVRGRSSASRTPRRVGRPGETRGPNEEDLAAAAASCPAISEEQRTGGEGMDGWEEEEEDDGRVFNILGLF